MKIVLKIYIFIINILFAFELIKAILLIHWMLRLHAFVTSFSSHLVFIIFLIGTYHPFQSLDCYLGFLLLPLPQHSSLFSMFIALYHLIFSLARVDFADVTCTCTVYICEVVLVLLFVYATICSFLVETWVILFFLFHLLLPLEQLLTVYFEALKVWGIS